MLAGRLPLPSYVLADGTPMVPAAHGELAEIAGGVDQLHDWFVAFWGDEPATGEQEWRPLPVRAVRLPPRGHAGADQAEDRAGRRGRRAVELLRRDPHDPIGRGMLGEAVDGVLAVPGLDSLLLPMTAYDRLRFGGPTSRETWVDAPRAEFLTPGPPVWPLRTERLVLRPFEPGDAAAFVDAWASEPCDQPPAHPADEPGRGRARWCAAAPSPATGTFVGHGRRARRPGRRRLDAHLQGTGLSEGEIGWTILPEHAGRGYATEARERRAAPGLRALRAAAHRGQPRRPQRPLRRPLRAPRDAPRVPQARRLLVQGRSGPTPTSTPSSPRSGGPRAVLTRTAARCGASGPRSPLVARGHDRRTRGGPVDDAHARTAPIPCTIRAMDVSDLDATSTLPAPYGASHAGVTRQGSCAVPAIRLRAAGRLRRGDDHRGHPARTRARRTAALRRAWPGPATRRPRGSTTCRSRPSPTST